VTEQPIFAEARGGGWFWWLQCRVPLEHRHGGRIPSQAKGPYTALEEAQAAYTHEMRRHA
jgi:hypothetical protein